jgi:hypothetical protein
MRFLLAVLAMVAPALLRAQTLSYVTTLAKDTVAIEQFRRDGSQIIGDYAIIQDSLVVHHFVIDVAKDGRFSRVALTSRRNGGRSDTTIVVFFGDSAFVSGTRPPEDGRTRWYAPGGVPMLVGANAFEGAAAQRALRMASNSVILPIVGVEGPWRGRFHVIIYSPDSVGLWNARTPAVVRFDSDGYVHRQIGPGSVPTETVRVSPFDFGSLLSQLSRRRARRRD